MIGEVVGGWVDDICKNKDEQKLRCYPCFTNYIQLHVPATHQTAKLLSSIGMPHFLIPTLSKLCLPFT